MKRKTENMQVVETLAQKNFRYGKCFLWIYSEVALASLATDNIIINVGNIPVVTDLIELKSNGEVISWQPFVGSVFEGGTGTIVQKLKRNPDVDSDIDTEVIVNPTITDEGTPFFSPEIELIAQSAAGNRAFLDTKLISSQFALAANTAYLIKITNKDVTSKKYDLEINICK